MNRLSDEQILVFAYLATCLLARQCWKGRGGVCHCDKSEGLIQCGYLPEQVRDLHELLQYRLKVGKFNPSRAFAEDVPGIHVASQFDSDYYFESPE